MSALHRLSANKRERRGGCNLRGEASDLWEPLEVASVVITQLSLKSQHMTLDTFSIYNDGVLANTFEKPVLRQMMATPRSMIPTPL